METLTHEDSFGVAGVKIANRQADTFSKQPDNNIVAVLVYGPNQGLVTERIRTLTSSVLEDANDPFRMRVLFGADLAADPTALSTEVNTLGFGGGRKVVVVKDVTERVKISFENILESDPAEVLVIVEGSDLRPASGLRKMFEKGLNVAAVACYGDEGQALAEVATAMLEENGLRIGAEALKALVQRLGADRLINRSELNKLALYLGPDHKEVSLRDVEAVVGNSSVVSLEDLGLAVGDGDLSRVDQALHKVFEEGIHSIAALRATATHLGRLQIAVGYLERGESLGAAVDKLRPPVFFKHKQVFSRQVGNWTGRRLRQATTILLDAEVDCKTTGYPHRLICERALFRVAVGAQRRNRGTRQAATKGS